MESKGLIWLGLFVGSTAGSFIPKLWGAGQFSISSLITSAIGALIGLWVGFKLTNW